MHESSHPGMAIKIHARVLANKSLSFCLKFSRYFNMVEPDKETLVFLNFIFLFFLSLWTKTAVADHGDTKIKTMHLLKEWQYISALTCGPSVHPFLSILCHYPSFLVPCSSPFPPSLPVWLLIQALICQKTLLRHILVSGEVVLLSSPQFVTFLNLCLSRVSLGSRYSTQQSVQEQCLVMTWGLALQARIQVCKRLRFVQSRESVWINRQGGSNKNIWLVASWEVWEALFLWPVKRFQLTFENPWSY